MSEYCGGSRRLLTATAVDCTRHRTARGTSEAPSFGGLPQPKAPAKPLQQSLIVHSTCEAMLVKAPRQWHPAGDGSAQQTPKSSQQSPLHQAALINVGETPSCSRDAPMLSSAPRTRPPTAYTVASKPNDTSAHGLTSSIWNVGLPAAQPAKRRGRRPTASQGIAPSFQVS